MQASLPVAAELNPLKLNPISSKRVRADSRRLLQIRNPVSRARPSLGRDGEFFVLQCVWWQSVCKTLVAEWCCMNYLHRLQALWWDFC